MHDDGGMLGVLPLALASLFDLGVGAYIVGRMRRAMTSQAFWTAMAIELGTLAVGVTGMIIKGFSIALMLVILGLAETAVVLSTWGRVEVFFSVIAAPESWTSRHANVVALRFCASIALIPCHSWREAVNSVPHHPHKPRSRFRVVIRSLSVHIGLAAGFVRRGR
jgi:hypothetical protein